MRVRTNGIFINAELEGPEHAPVATLSHSLAASLEMWRPQMPTLTRRFRVLRYDTRGHGGTDVPAGPYRLEDLAEDVYGLFCELGIERTHFVGLSMGGMIGQQLALARPEVLKSLVLADTLSAYPPQARTMWEERIAAASGPRGMEPLVEPTVARWFTQPFRDANPGTIDWIRSLIRATPPAGFVGCCHALMTLNLTDKLSSIRLPTEVIVGRQDPTTPVSGAEVIRNAIPGAHLTVIEDAAHISNVEQPDAFNAALEGFFARVT
jgi:3-oxoadipate enol-lactonase